MRQALLSWRCLNTSMPMGNSELISVLCLWVQLLLSLLNLSLFQPMSVLAFILLILSLIPLRGGGRRRVAAQGLHSGTKSEHLAPASPYCIYAGCTAVSLSWFFQYFHFAPIILDLNPVPHTSGLSLFRLVYRLNKLILSCHPLRDVAGLANGIHPGLYQSVV